MSGLTVALIAILVGEKFQLNSSGKGMRILPRDASIGGRVFLKMNVVGGLNK